MANNMGKSTSWSMRRAISSLYYRQLEQPNLRCIVHAVPCYHFDSYIMDLAWKTHLLINGRFMLPRPHYIIDDRSANLFVTAWANSATSPFATSWAICGTISSLPCRQLWAVKRHHRTPTRQQRQRCRKLGTCFDNHNETRLDLSHSIQQLNTFKFDIAAKQSKWTRNIQVTRSIT